MPGGARFHLKTEGELCRVGGIGQRVHVRSAAAAHPDLQIVRACPRAIANAYHAVVCQHAE